ncbi:MAG TPA: lasso peptide biosynthesis B2 protein [Bryobacteraceae bacterium]|nr:lasso peptide biosynthesis B2 protein [Bryobacteraceae bacterium]
MSPASYALLLIGAFWQIVRYDVVNGAFGFQRIHRQVARQKVVTRAPVPGLETVVCDAVSLAACFYWKPVLCLQRSVAAALLLRKHGINGRLVIGYRPAPFFSHAWVEVDGRVVNDLPGYKERLQVLCSA